MHTTVTLVGHLTEDPKLLKIKGGSYLCRMRMASSRRVRRFPESSGGSTNTETLSVEPEQIPEQESSTANEGNVVVAATPEGSLPAPSAYWGDTDTLFVDVECWGQLAINAKTSLVKGRPIMATGYLVTQSWGDVKAGTNRSKNALRASHIGLELSRYVAGSRKSAPEDVVAVTGIAAPDSQHLSGAVPDTDYTVSEESEPSKGTVRTSTVKKTALAPF